MLAEAAVWYVQKGARVQGPFSAAQVARFLLLGRVRRSDRVSRDGELWEPVTQVPELVPEELLDLESPDGWRRYLDARAAGDDRGDGRDRERGGDLDLDGGRGGDRDADVGPGIRIERRDGIDVLARVREEWREERLGHRPEGRLGGRLDGLPEERPARRRPRASGRLLPWSLLGLTLAGLGVLLWLDRAGMAPV